MHISKLDLSMHLASALSDEVEVDGRNLDYDDFTNHRIRFEQRWSLARMQADNVLAWVRRVSRREPHPVHPSEVCGLFVCVWACVCVCVCWVGGWVGGCVKRTRQSCSRVRAAMEEGRGCGCA